MTKLLLRSLLVGLLLGGGTYQNLLAAKGDAFAVPDVGAERNSDVFRIDAVNNVVEPGVDDTYDLGSSALEWKDGYFDGTVYVDGFSNSGATTLTGATTQTGTLNVDGNLTSTGADISITTHVTITGGNLTMTGGSTIEDATIDDLNVHETLYLGEGAAISTFVPTAITLDDGVTLTVPGTLNVTGTLMQNLDSINTLAVPLQQTWGATTAISTFVPTALTLDDGLALTVAGTANLDGAVTSTGDAIDVSTHVVFGAGANLTIVGTANIEDATIDDLNAHETLYMGETTAISTWTPTALTLDDGLTLTANGPVTLNSTLGMTGVATIEDAIIDDLNAHETLYVGETTAISTFTPTALTLDDGLTFTHTSAKRVISSNGSTWTEVIISTQLADAQDYDVTETTSKAGFGHVIAMGHASSGEFSFTNSGVVTLADQTNLNTSDGNDTTLNVYDSGDNIAIENQLGGTYTLVIHLFFQN